MPAAKKAAEPRKKSTSTRTRVNTPAKKPRVKLGYVTHDFPGPFASVEFKEDRLKSIITQWISSSHGYHTAHRYKNSFPVQMLVTHRQNIQNHFSGFGPASGLVEIIDGYTRDLKKYADEARAQGEIEFLSLGSFFEVDAPMVTTVEGKLLGGRVASASLKSTWIGVQYYEITLRVFNNIHGQIQEQLLPVHVVEYPGKMKITHLPLRPLDDDDRAVLSARGQKFLRYAGGATYVSYTGQLVKNSWWSSKAYRADGRVMLDPSTFQQIDNDQHSNESRAAGFSDMSDDGPANRARSRGDRKEQELPAGEEWRCYPFVYGFSFSAKQWGRLDLDGVSEVLWREDAFEKLVLAAEDKELIRALVEHQGGTFQDLIEGKGGGVIFLLHGPPGEGKTLTSEAVAELLHKPLYSVSVGELGTDPDQLEARLRTVLDIATVWDAVVLMDEADIFLEARDEHDILRNAMVGVFLRLLEYHQGVLFLTTNRVKNIDHAFYSRISIALHFSKGDTAKRQKIWTNLLAAAKIEGLDPASLSAFPLNGRQIKSIIRLSQTLAKARNVPITGEIVTQVVDRVTRFETDLNAIKEGN